MIDKVLLDILACPKCKGKIIVTNKDGNKTEKNIDLEYNEERNRLICNNCRLIYKIEDGIPVMLIEEAESF